jgi:hypothetical protein
MEVQVIDDDLWTLIKPLLSRPEPRGKRDPGRPRVWNRAALNGILSVNTVAGWANIAGSSKELTPGSRTFAVFVCASSIVTTYIMRFLKLGCSLVCWNSFRRSEQDFLTGHLVQSGRSVVDAARRHRSLSALLDPARTRSNSS